MEESKEHTTLSENKIPFGQKFGKFHDKHYKLLLLIPIIITLFSLIYLGAFYHNSGEFFHKDISLTGGTSVTINHPVNLQEFNDALTGKLEDFESREVYDLITRKQVGVIIETKSSEEETRSVLEDYLGYELNEQNSSFEFTGSALSESFFKQLVTAIVVAFVFMGIVVFIIFRNPVPSGAVIISAFADILMTLVTINLLGIELSSAGIVALLMLIGYSVDTDILLTTRVLRRQGNINGKIHSAFKTGITMTLTSLSAVTVALIIVSSFSVVLTQIFAILVIGLAFDILNTWITNVSILKWYVEHKNESPGRNRK